MHSSKNIGNFDADHGHYLEIKTIESITSHLEPFFKADILVIEIWALRRLETEYLLPFPLLSTDMILLKIRLLDPWSCA